MSCASASNALRSIATRSAGTLGRRDQRPRRGLLREMQLHHLAVGVVLDEVERGGRSPSSGSFCSAPCISSVTLLVAQPVRPHRLEARPRPVADALHLAALDRERDLRRAVVAGDDLELGADQRVVEPRRGLRIDPGDAADDQLLVEQVLRGLVRGGVPGERHRGLAVEAAEPVEFVDLEPHAGRIDQLGEQDAALEQRDRGAVLRRRAEHVLAAAIRDGMFCTTIEGLPGNVLAEMARRRSAPADRSRRRRRRRR